MFGSELCLMVVFVCCVVVSICCLFWLSFPFLMGCSIHCLLFVVVSGLCCCVMGAVNVMTIKLDPLDSVAKDNN